MASGSTNESVQGCRQNQEGEQSPTLILLPHTGPCALVSQTSHPSGIPGSVLVHHKGDRTSDGLSPRVLRMGDWFPANGR